MDNTVISFLADHSVGVLSTCNDGKPYGSPVYYHFTPEQKAFYFLTKNQSRKYLELNTNTQASFSVFSEAPPTSFLAECTAEILEFSLKAYQSIITRLIEIHSTRDYYPSPISTMMEGELKLIRLDLIDFSFNAYQRDIEKLQSRS